MQLMSSRPRLLAVYPSVRRHRHQQPPPPSSQVSYHLYYLKAGTHSGGYLVVRTTAGKAVSYCCFAVTSLELWCLCCLVLVTATSPPPTVDANLQLDHRHHHHDQQDLRRNPLDRRHNDTEYSAYIRRDSEIRTSATTLGGDQQLQRVEPRHRIVRREEGRSGITVAAGDKRLSEEDVDLVTTPTTPEHSSSTTSKVFQAAVATPSVTPRDPMSPVHPDPMDTLGSNVVVFVLVLALVLVTLGVLTCILSTYRYRSSGGGAGGGGGGGGGDGHRARSAWPHHHHHHNHHQLPAEAPGLLGSNANLPMLALPGGMCDDRLSRDMAAHRDRHVRLKSVKQDMELDLPPSIRLPDGEELPYGCSTRLHIRDPEQESEIYQKCVRPPPNRTVYDSESPPPYRSSSAGLLTHPCVDWSSDSSQVIRCHSMSSGSAPTPSVVVPSRSRRLSAFTDAAPARAGALSTLTMVPCHGRPAPSESV